jgi:vacuolar-type H+-ATPase subunit H
MTESTSVLAIINQKELELRRRVEEAQRQAETLIQAARHKAEQMIVQADEQARLEAEVLHKHGIEEANEEAEALITAAGEQAAALQWQAKARLGDVARQIVALVLPAGSSSHKEAQVDLVHSADTTWSH